MDDKQTKREEKKNGKKRIFIPVAVAFCTIFCTFLTSCTGNNGDWGGDAVKTTGCYSVEINVVSSLKQWGSLSSQIGGVCVLQNNILENASVDAHEFEPTTSQINDFYNADLIVVNGAGYDTWAVNAASDAKKKNSNIQIVNIAEINGVQDGANPHLWNDITYVSKAESAISVAMSQVIANKVDKSLSETKVDKNATDLTSNAKISQTRADRIGDIIKNNLSSLADKTNALQDKINASNLESKKAVCSETVLYYLLNSLKINDVTPEGYYNAVSNEGEPSAGDMNTILNMISDNEINFAVINSQEKTNATTQIEDAAKKANCKVIESTEVMPDKYDSLVDWLQAEFEEFTD